MRVVSEKSEWIIFAGVVLLVSTAFTDSLLPWLALAILTTSLITTGIRLLRQRLQPVKGIFFLVAGSVISLVILTASYWVMSLDPTFTKSNAEIIKRNIESHKCDQKLKSKISKLYASDVYKNDGAIVNYLTEAGKPTPYRPTKEDIEHRDNILKLNRIIKTAQGLARPIFYCWLAITLFSVIAGLFTNIQRKGTGTDIRSPAG